MDVRISDTAGDDLPRLAAVLAVPHAVYFEAGTDVLDGLTCGGPVCRVPAAS
jgi:hypothetical protein